MKKLYRSVVAAAALSGALYAGGDFAPPPPVVMDDWSGPYIGVQLGGLWGNADVDYNFTDYTTIKKTINVEPYPGAGYTIPQTTYVKQSVPVKTHNSMDVNGWTGGLFAGYNWLLENDFLIGVEGEWNYVDADATEDIVGDNGITYGKTTVEQDWDASLRLRAGMVMGDILPYITGGIAWGGMNLKGDALVAGQTIRWDEDKTLTGWTVGAGVEMKINEHLHARIQYRYTDYGDDTIDVVKNGQELLHGKLDYNAHMVTVGLSYRF